MPPAAAHRQGARGPAKRQRNGLNRDKRQAMLSVNSVHPVNPDYGVYQGTPIARHYIDAYMADVSAKLSGVILEFGCPTYAKSIDCEYEILDIDATNPQATIHGDVCDPEVGRKLMGRFDGIICTAVLQLVPDPQAAVANMQMMLKPGGSLIIAEKALSRIDPWSTNIDRWRFTQHGLEHLMRNFARVDVHHYGNVYASCACLLGLPAEQIEPDKLAHVDSSFPIVIVAHGQK
jgi:SAM-dependent methyltransferase